tara:strand:+ start:40 stop:234 length:195 start_codon:yes stop_codon:yes gene_type:complete
MTTVLTNMINYTTLKVYASSILVLASPLGHASIVVQALIGVAALFYTVAKGINEWKKVFGQDKE